MRNAAASNTKKGRNIFYNILIVILIGIMLFSGYNLVKILWTYHQGTVAYNELADLAGMNDDLKKITVSDWTTVDWNALLEDGPDVKAWLRSPSTVINYPVAQGKDNDLYLHHLINGEYDFKGTIFIDYRCQNPFTDFQTVLYGHKMNDGSMFACIRKYLLENGYYKAHPVMQLYTPAQNYLVEIFGALRVNSNDTYIYNFNLSAAGDEEKQAYLNYIIENNEIPDYPKNEISVSPQDAIVMLSTCHTEKEKDRFVVWGKLTPQENVKKPA